MQTVQRRNPWPLIVRLALGWLAFTVALLLAAYFSEELLASSGVSQALIQGAVVTGLVIPVIYMLRRHADRGDMAGLGLGISRVGMILVGFSGVLLMATLALVLCEAVGWVRIVSVNLDASSVSLLLTTLAYIFFYEALPEETVFRGYLYTNLNTVLPLWLALAAQVTLFVGAPVASVAVQAHLLGMEISIGGEDRITLIYIILLTVFGCALQFCRILTGSLWTSIGFHMGFITSARFIGPHERALVQVEDIIPRTTEEVVVFLGALVTPLVLMIIWAIIFRKRIGWGARRKDAPA